MSLRSRCSAALALLVLTGCGEGPSPGDGRTVRDSAGIRIVETGTAPAWEAEEGWYVEPSFRSDGAPGGGGELGFVSDVTVAPDGRVYALDMLGQRLQVFSPDGSPAGTVGGPGQGPGEFGKGIRSMLLAPGGADGTPELWVPDGMTMRAQRFSLDGTYRGAVVLASGKASPGIWRMGADGQVYLRSVEHTRDDAGAWSRTDLLLRLRGWRSEGDAGRGAGGTLAARVDTVLAFEYRQDDLAKAPGTGLPPVVNAPAWAVLADGTVAWTSIRDASVRLHRPDGTRVSLRRESWQGRTPSQGEEEALQILAVESLRMQGAPIGPDAEIPFEPMSWLPVVTDLRAGPGGTLWVQTLGSVRDVHPMNLNTGAEPFGWGGATWEVFDGEGRYLGAVDLPSRFRVTEIRGDRIAGVQYDRNLVDQVVVLEIVQP